MDYHTLEHQSQIVQDLPQSDAPSLYQVFQQLPDSRKRRGVCYELALILTLLLLGRLWQVAKACER